MYDLRGNEVAFISQKMLSFLPRFLIYVNGREAAEIVKRFTLIRQKYSIDKLDWEIDGDFWSHNYEITKNGKPIVTINKKWMTWGDCYELNILNPNDEIVALAVVLSIDCVIAAQRAASSAN